MKAHRLFWGILTVTQSAAVAILVIAALLGSGGQASADQKFNLIYFDGHMYSAYSEGSGSVTEIKTTALKRGLSAVIVTDHCKDLAWEI